MPYYLDYEKFLEENEKYLKNLTKCKGILIFNKENNKIKYDTIIKYKEQIEKIKKKLIDKENPLIIKSSTNNIIDIILGSLIGCSHYEMTCPYIYAEAGKCLNINFNDFNKEKNYGNIKDLENFDFLPNLLDFNDIKYLNETVEITQGCKCFSCQTGYKRSYLYHLFKCKELNGPIIIAIHNYFQVRELYIKLCEFKNNEGNLNNFIMWFLSTQCTHVNK